MATIVSGNGGDFTPAPAGTHQGVCVDVVNHGLLETQWGKKQKVTVRWQIDELMPGGKRFLVSKRYTASLNEKAVLRHDLESWRGRAFTADELAGFDLDVLLGVNCLLNVVHVAKDGKTWANVQSIAPLLKSMAKMQADNYTKERDRQPEPTAATKPGDPEDDRTYDDDSVPF